MEMTLGESESLKHRAGQSPASWETGPLQPHRCRLFLPGSSIHGRVILPPSMWEQHVLSLLQPNKDFSLLHARSHWLGGQWIRGRRGGTPNLVYEGFQRK